MELILLAFRFCRHCLQNSGRGDIELAAKRKASFRTTLDLQLSCDLPLCVQILFELSRIQHLISDNSHLLQGGDVFADTVIQLRVVPFGEQFVNHFPEALNLLELMENGILLLFSLCAFLAEQVRLPIAQRSLTLLDIDRLQGKELVATPLVDDNEGIKSLTRPGGDMSDKRGLRQVHEEVQVIGKIGKKVVIDVVVNLLAKNGRESGKLRGSEHLLLKLLFNAVNQNLFTAVANQWHNTVVIFIENFADQVGKELHRNGFRPLLWQYTAFFEEVPGVNRVDLVPDAELFEVVVTLVERLKLCSEVGNLLPAHGHGWQGFDESKDVIKRKLCRGLCFAQICYSGFGKYREAADGTIALSSGVSS